MQAVSSLRGLESACRRRHLSVPAYLETALRRSQSLEFPEQRELLGDPSHAGDPDDSSVFCGESIWPGECGLAWQQVGFNAFHCISRSVWVLLVEKVGKQWGMWAWPFSWAGDASAPAVAVP